MTAKRQFASYIQKREIEVANNINQDWSARV